MRMEILGLIIIILLPLVVAALGFLTSLLLAPRNPNPNKLRRYEAGNPPYGEAKAPLLMQYMGFALLLVSIEPIAVISALVLIGATASSIVVLVCAILVSIAVAALAYRYSKDIREWSL